MKVATSFGCIRILYLYNDFEWDKKEYMVKPFFQTTFIFNGTDRLRPCHWLLYLIEICFPTIQTVGCVFLIFDSTKICICHAQLKFLAVSSLALPDLILTLKSPFCQRKVC